MSSLSPYDTLSDAELAQRLRNRTTRLLALLSYNAPPIVLQGEHALIRDAAAAWLRRYPTDEITRLRDALTASEALVAQWQAAHGETLRQLLAATTDHET